MKLTELAIDGYGICRDLKLGRFGSGLNVIFGETGSGKSTVRKFVRGVLYGFDSSPTPSVSTVPGGSLQVQSNDLDYRLLRDVRVSGNLSLQSLSPSSPTQLSHGLDQLTGSLPADLFDTFFSVGFHDTRQNSFQLASQLHYRLGVPLGKTALRDEAARARWQQERDSLQSQMASIQQRIDSLTIEKRGYHHEIDKAQSLRNQQLAGIERNLAEISNRLNSINSLPIENEVANLRAEISRVHDLIANAEVQYVPEPAPIPAVSMVDGHTNLYQRLDEIDNQIRRWRRVQTDIQNQRVRLRDEMMVWNELTLDSQEHPYHNARRILVALESKVDQAENRVTTWNPNDNRDQSVRQLGDLCKQMREDIYGLCQELGHQYKHIRHKAAAAELKQLRRCYNEMGENTERLVKRREAVVNEIRQVDPAGADAIQRAEHQFCQCAQHEGYLEARRRYIGNLTPQQPQPAVYTTVRPNLDSHRARLSDLERQLSDRLGALNQLEAERKELQVRHADLVAQRDRLVSQVNRNDLHAKIENIDFELRRLTDQYNEVSLRLDSLEYVETPPDPILDVAGNYVSRMSLGELSHVWLGNQPGELLVSDRRDQTFSFDSLSRGQQDEVYLSLLLAAADALNRQGMSAPMLLDDVFANLDAQRTLAALDAVREHCRRGNQVLAFAKGNEISVSNSSEVVVFELPQTGVTTTPYSQPERQSYVPLRENHWESSLEEGTPFFKTYREPAMLPVRSELNTYPLSKYPQGTTRVNLSPETFEDNRIVAPIVDQAPVWTDSRGVFSEASLIANDGIVEVSHLDILGDLGISTVGDLLDVDADDLGAGVLRAGLNSSQFDRWQAQYWMMICVPALNVNDVQVLHACGITDPELLDTIHSHQLWERIERFLRSPDGRRFQSQSQIDDRQIQNWYRSLESTKSRWQRTDGYRRGRQRSQRSSSFGPRLSRPSNERNSGRSYDDRQTEPRIAEPRVIREPRVVREPKERTRSRSRRTSESVETTTPMVRNFTERQRAVRPTTKASKTVQSAKSSDSKLKFYLDLADHVEAAPSIGPRTAERFEKIGVVTVSDFLKQTAESMAAKINYKRITADVVRDWQNQTRLVCRVPNLRGHDAQLLVACGITEPEDISAMSPGSLFEIIGPFSETKEGLKIIRSGKKPDLDEIKDWIEWAGHTRSLQAA